MKSILIPAALALALAAFRELNVRPRRELSLVDIARQINPLLRSWIEYYGRYALSTLYPLLRYATSRLRDAEVQAGFLAASLRDRANPDDKARYLAQWQAEGRVVVEKSAHRHAWIASITGSCTILCSAPASRVCQRMQASVELPLDHSAEECLRNSEYSLSPRLILVFGCAAAYGQGAGVGEDPTGNSRCIMGARVKAAVATDASQGMMSHQQGVETRSAVERIAAFAAAARSERLTTDIRQLFKRNILDSLGCAIRVAALIEEARLRSAA